MNTLLLILVVLAGIVLLLLILALLLPKHYSVTVSENIHRPKHIVYEYVSAFRNQIQYSEWLKADPDLQPEVLGIDGTAGSILKWESENQDKNKNVGSGEQEIIKMDENKIEVELRLLKPMAATCKVINRFEPQGNDHTLYTCTFYAYAKFPINLPSYFFGRNFIRITQQKTLSNIKTILEAI